MITFVTKKTACMCTYCTQGFLSAVIREREGMVRKIASLIVEEETSLKKRIPNISYRAYDINSDLGKLLEALRSKKSLLKTQHAMLEQLYLWKDLSYTFDDDELDALVYTNRR